MLCQRLAFEAQRSGAPTRYNEKHITSFKPYGLHILLSRTASNAHWLQSRDIHFLTTENYHETYHRRDML